MLRGPDCRLLFTPDGHQVWCTRISRMNHRPEKVGRWFIPVAVLYWMYTVWLTGRIPESLCWHVIARGQRLANRSKPQHSSISSLCSASSSFFCFYCPLYVCLLYKMSCPCSELLTSLKSRETEPVECFCPSAAALTCFLQSQNWNENMQGFIIVWVRGQRELPASNIMYWWDVNTVYVSLNRDTILCV